MSAAHRSKDLGQRGRLQHPDPVNQQVAHCNFNHHGGIIMWTKPEYTEMRFGFEVTMYIANR